MIDKLSPQPVQEEISPKYNMRKINPIKKYLIWVPFLIILALLFNSMKETPLYTESRDIKEEFGNLNQDQGEQLDLLKSNSNSDIFEIKKAVKNVIGSLKSQKKVQKMSIEV